MRAISKDKKLVEERREQIADGAVQLFIKRGYEGTSMREIAEACNMSVGNMYNYVKSKEDVLFLAMEHAIRVGVADIRTGSKDPVKGLKEAVKNAYGVMDREQNYVLFLYQEAKNLPPRYRTRILDVDRDYAAKFEDLLAQGIERKVFRADIDPFLVAQNILTLGHMWAFRRWLLRGECTFEQFLERQLDFILAAITDDHNR
jgi:AcrR family transcriptional regulator